MNLSCIPQVFMNSTSQQGYTFGHRDARHAAAEIAAEADTRIERLEKALRELVKVNEEYNGSATRIMGRSPIERWNESQLAAAREALNNTPEKH
jgi:hypothetical protein